VAAEIGALLPAAALAHPAFDPLRPWLRKLGATPGVAELNRLAAAASPATASGHPVRFCPPEDSGEGHYEQKVFDTGRVATRPDNLHDLFNALVWIAFPRTKAALNARHVERLHHEGALRGPLRDLLTLVDEGGVIVACSEEASGEIESLVRGFHWQALFWERRASLLQDCRFVLTGHNTYEKALSPYAGITCKCLFVPTPRDRLAGNPPDLVGWLDARAADWLSTLPDSAVPRQMAPLPVFGYPGWLPDSANAGFYADRRWFRPGRKA
jgi:Protein of unknown function (DUF3025)